MFVLRDGSYYELGPKKIEQYKQTYQRIDVIQELKNCAQWDIDNPGKRKTKTGILRHINAWLAKANKDKGYISKAPEPDTESEEYRKKILQQFTPEQLAANRKKLAAISKATFNRG